MTAPTAAARIGPADHGRRMSLADFEHAEGEAGRLYELGRGVIAVMDVPNPAHLAQLQSVRDQLVVYKVTRRGDLHTIAGGGECKIPVDDAESERHPDLAAYGDPPPSSDSNAWREWVPLVVVEVVSPGSETRDYQEKRDEYLRFGVREYWIIDHARREMLALRRTSGRWREIVVRPGEPYRTPSLPEFELDLAAVFAAADAAKG